MKVKFPLVFAPSGAIEYPDSIDQFRETEIVGNEIIAEYIGGLPLSPYSPPDAPLTVFAFRALFTQSEKIAIYTAKASSVIIEIWLDDLSAASEVYLNHPDTIAGIVGLRDAGILTTSRMEAILNASMGG